MSLQMIELEEVTMVTTSDEALEAMKADEVAGGAYTVYVNSTACGG